MHHQHPFPRRILNILGTARMSPTSVQMLIILVSLVLVVMIGVYLYGVLLRLEIQKVVTAGDQRVGKKGTRKVLATKI